MGCVVWVIMSGTSARTRGSVSATNSRFSMRLPYSHPHACGSSGSCQLRGYRPPMAGFVMINGCRIASPSNIVERSGTTTMHRHCISSLHASPKKLWKSDQVWCPARRARLAIRRSRHGDMRNEPLFHNGCALLRTRNHPHQLPHR